MTPPTEAWRVKFRNDFVNDPGDWRDTGWTVPFVQSPAKNLEAFISDLIEKTRKEGEQYGYRLGVIGTATGDFNVQEEIECIKEEERNRILSLPNQRI